MWGTLRRTRPARKKRKKNKNKAYDRILSLFYLTVSCPVWALGSRQDWGRLKAEVVG